MDRGGGKKSRKIADVVYEWSLNTTYGLVTHIYD